MNESETPEWLQDNGESPNPTASGPSDTFGESSTDDANKTDQASKSSRCSCGRVFLGLISLILIAIFVYSAIVQGNDEGDAIQWIIFYSLNAVVPAIFLMHYICCFPVRVLHLFSVAMVIWSIVLIVIASLKLSDTAAGGGVSGGDNDNATLQEEYIFELAGASIGLVSSLFHSLMAKCCVKKGTKAGSAAPEEINPSEQV